MAQTAGTPYKRHCYALFLDENFGTSPRYVIQGADLESGSVETGINSESKTNILDEVSFKITEWTPTFAEDTFVAKKGDKIFDKLIEGYFTRATADYFETTACEVILDTDGVIEKCYKSTVRLEPTSFGGDGGAELTAPFTIHFTGIPEAVPTANVSISDGVLTISTQ